MTNFFIFYGQKISICLIQDTITLYVKPTGDFRWENISNSEDSFSENNSNACHESENHSEIESIANEASLADSRNSDESEQTSSSKVTQRILVPIYTVESDHPIFTTNDLDNLGLKGMIDEDDPEHNTYHQDGVIDKNNEHYHLWFGSVITIEKFLQILEVFEKYLLISTDEKNRCIHEYLMSNEQEEKTSHTSSSSYQFFSSPTDTFEEKNDTQVQSREELVQTQSSQKQPRNEMEESRRVKTRADEADSKTLDKEHKLQIN